MYKLFPRDFKNDFEEFDFKSTNTSSIDDIKFSSSLSPEATALFSITKSQEGQVRVNAAI